MSHDNEDIDMDDLEDFWAVARGEARSRTVDRTPGSARRRKTPRPRSRGRSRSRGATRMELKFRSPSNKASAYAQEAARLIARPKSERDKFDLYHLNKGKSLDQIDRLWEQRKSGKYKIKTRKVRHKNARTELKKMPAGRKPYAKGRKSKTYRGAVLPRIFKGETKHVLVHDGMYSGFTNAPDTSSCAQLTKANLSTVSAHSGELVMGLGTLSSWCLNPCPQGNEATSRNGRSVDGTYLRVQGHIRNRDAQNKAYVRMMVLAVKGGQADGKAKFNDGTLFKKIDGNVVGYDSSSGTAGSGKGSKRVRSLQLPVNRQMYTVLYDQKMQLASTAESFGSSDRLFDAKIKLKQKTKFFDEHAASFESNQLVFVVYTVDPTCADALVAVDNTAGQETGIALEFESKYSYKDF